MRQIKKCTYLLRRIDEYGIFIAVVNISVRKSVWLVFSFSNQLVYDGSRFATRVEEYYRYYVKC